MQTLSSIGPATAARPCLWVLGQPPAFSPASSASVGPKDPLLCASPAPPHPPMITPGAPLNADNHRRCVSPGLNTDKTLSRPPDSFCHSFLAGGGVVVTPLLALTSGMSQADCVGTSLCAMIPPAAAGLLQHHAMGNVNW